MGLIHRVASILPVTRQWQNAVKDFFKIEYSRNRDSPSLQKSLGKCSVFTEQNLSSPHICLFQILEEGAAQEVMSGALLSEGRVNHINMMMGLHPTYLNCFLRTQNALLQLDGPLPLSWRHFIIILVRLSTFRLQVSSINECLLSTQQ